MSRLPHSRAARAVLALSLAAPLAPAAAQVKCTDITTVQITALPAMNTQYGGHLTQHIYGQTPPAGLSQAGKTLFRDSTDWQEAYDELQQMDPPLYCSQRPQAGAEAARDVPGQYFSYQCTAANASGMCTRKTEIQTNTVRIIMRYVDNRWIVYTGYPIPQ